MIHATILRCMRMTSRMKSWDLSKPKSIICYMVTMDGISLRLLFLRRRSVRESGDNYSSRWKIKRPNGGIRSFV